MGANSELDEAISRRGDMEEFLRQGMHVGVDYETSIAELLTVLPVNTN
jgi:flagellar biosynthesis/type III secretory pathway ATPase